MFILIKIFFKKPVLVTEFKQVFTKLSYCVIINTVIIFKYMNFEGPTNNQKKEEDKNKKTIEKNKEVEGGNKNNSVTREKAVDEIDFLKLADASKSQEELKKIREAIRDNEVKDKKAESFDSTYILTENELDSLMKNKELINQMNHVNDKLVNISNETINLVDKTLKTSGEEKQEEEKKEIKDLIELLSYEELKEGINFVFEQNSELVKIGSKEKYYEYLKSIFPESKLRQIVYHYSSVGDKIKEDGFKSAVEQRSRVAGLNKDAIYFTGSPVVYWGGGSIELDRVCTLLNIKSPLDFSRYPKGVELEDLSEEDKNKFKRLEELEEKAHYGENSSSDMYDNSAIFTKLLKEEGYDSILWPELEEIEVFDKENIYILGNQNDLEGFKKFII